MVEIADIKDEDSLREWLGTQTGEVATAVAHRAAMRVAPFYWERAHPVSSRKEWMAQHVLRPLLTSGVACTYSTPEVKAAAARSERFASEAEESAASYARFGPEAESDAQVGAAEFAARSANAAFHAALFAARSAAARSGAADFAARSAARSAIAFATASRFGAADFAARFAVAWPSVRKDCEVLAGNDTGAAVFAQSLWSGGESPLGGAWEKARAAWLAAGPGWQFWIDWYEGALAGRPPNWDMLTEIALIPNEDWKAGPERVNGLIAGIQLKYAIKATPNAEVVSFNSATGKMRVDPVSDLPKDHLTEAVERLRNVLVLFEGHVWPSNQFRPIDTEFAIIRQAVSHYGARPRMLHSACLRVIRRMDIKFRNGECPEPDQDADISDFYTTVVSVEADLILNDPLIREAAIASTAAKLPLLEPGEIETLVKAADAVAAMSEDVLAEELPVHIREAFEPSADLDTRKEWFIVAAGRLCRILCPGVVTP